MSESSPVILRLWMTEPEPLGSWHSWWQLLSCMACHGMTSLPLACLAQRETQPTKFFLTSVSQSVSVSLTKFLIIAHDSYRVSRHRKVTWAMRQCFQMSDCQIVDQSAVSPSLTESQAVSICKRPEPWVPPQVWSLALRMVTWIHWRRGHSWHGHDANLDLN